jgi:ketosteroid isomerase-like protein
VKAFRQAIEARDVEALEALLADDVVFRSPAVHKPYEGKLATSVVLRAVMRVFEDFRYTREIGADGSPDHVLVFEATVGDRSVEGADFLHVRADGLIDDFRVMIRPLSGLNAVVAAMQAVLPDVMREMGLADG